MNAEENADWQDLLWKNISAVIDGEVLWNCGCVTDMVNGAPQRFEHVNKSCEAHLALWPILGITFDE